MSGWVGGGGWGGTRGLEGRWYEGWCGKVVRGVVRGGDTKGERWNLLILSLLYLLLTCIGGLYIHYASRGIN